MALQLVLQVVHRDPVTAVLKYTENKEQPGLIANVPIAMSIEKYYRIFIVLLKI